MSLLIRQARAILSLLQPMNGDIATGEASCSALTAPVVLQKNEYLIPVLNGRALPGLLFKTTANTTIGLTQTTFGIKSILGHTDHNTLPVGTVMMFDPPLEGLQDSATISTQPTGATLYTGFGSAKSVKLYESIPAGDLNESLFKVDAQGMPALILTWMGSGETTPGNKGLYHMEDRWMLYCISARADSDHSRRAEGLYIMDEATEWLFDRSFVDNECISTPANIEITGRDRLAINATTYAYTVSFKTERSVSKRDRRVFPQWSKTTLMAPATTGIETPVPLINITIPQP